MAQSTTSHHVLVLVGHFASGKSSVAQHIRAARGASVVEVGDVVRAGAAAVGEDLGAFSSRQMTSDDPVYFTRTALTQLLAMASPRVLVGVRTVQEADYVANVAATVLVALIASESTRRERWAHREYGFRHPRSDLDFEKREAMEASWGIDELIHSAHYKIDANQPLMRVTAEVLRVWDMGLGESK